MRLTRKAMRKADRRAAWGLQPPCPYHPGQQCTCAAKKIARREAAKKD